MYMRMWMLYRECVETIRLLNSWGSGFFFCKTANQQPWHTTHHIHAGLCQSLNARLQFIQCISNGDTAVFQYALDCSWWHHQMETFSALLAICAGNSPVSGEFPAQRPVTRSFDVFFDLCLSKRLIKDSWGWRFEMPLHSLWCHCNGNTSVTHFKLQSCKTSLTHNINFICPIILKFCKQHSNVNCYPCAEFKNN